MGEPCAIWHCVMDFRLRGNDQKESLRRILRVPNIMKPLRRCAQNRWWREGRGVSYREYARRVRQSVPRRAEQALGATRPDATPERDNSVLTRAGLSRACAVASPQAGPLLHAPARRRFWPQPGGLARVLAQGFVARLANIRDIHCAALRALKQNRASAAGVSLC